MPIPTPRRRPPCTETFTGTLNVNGACTFPFQAVAPDGMTATLTTRPSDTAIAVGALARHLERRRRVRSRVTSTIKARSSGRRVGSGLRTGSTSASSATRDFTTVGSSIDRHASRHSRSLVGTPIQAGHSGPRNLVRVISFVTPAPERPGPAYRMRATLSPARSALERRPHREAERELRRRLQVVVEDAARVTGCRPRSDRNGTFSTGMKNRTSTPVEVLNARRRPMTSSSAAIAPTRRRNRSAFVNGSVRIGGGGGIICVEVLHPAEASGRRPAPGRHRRTPSSRTGPPTLK